MKQCFIGSQLKAAMDYRKILVGELAEKTGISRQTLSGYRNMADGEMSSENIEKIAAALNFPKEFFYVNSKDKDNGSVFFRSLLKTKKAYQSEQKVKMEFLGKIYSFLEKYIEFPILQIPDCSGLSPSIAAQRLREYWGLESKPILNLVNLVESKGIIVSTGNIDTDTIDAFSQRISFSVNDAYRYIIFYSDNKKSASRVHFDIAHELGHICLHQSVIVEELEKNEFIECENQANEFASSFLLPEAAFKREFVSGDHSIAHYTALKRKWQVSIQAMLMRSKNLGLITSDTYLKHILTLQKRGQIKREPLDDELLTASPSLLKSAVLLLLDAKCFTPREFVKALGTEGDLPINGSEVDTLLNLPSMTLGELDRSTCLSILKRPK